MSKKRKLLAISVTILFFVFFVSFLKGMDHTKYLINKNIERTKLDLIKSKKEELKKDVETLYKTINAYYEVNHLKTKPLYDNQMAQKNLFQYIQELTSEQWGYYWVTDTHMNILLHPTFKDYENKNIEDINSVLGKKQIKKIYERISSMKESWFEYRIKDTKTNQMKSKIAYIKLFNSWGWVIGKSIDLDSINHEIEDLREQIQEDIEHFLFIIFISIVIGVLFVSFIITTITDKSIFKPIENDIFNLNESLKTKNNELLKQLYVDDLTGMQNLASLKMDLSSLEYSSLLLVDIDSFDNINKLYGYDIGDKLLISYGNILKKFAQPRYYKVYRLYSNTFALLDQKPFFKVDVYYQDILDLINHQNNINLAEDFNIHLDVNIGVCLCQDNAIVKANTALSQAKKNYRRFFIYNASLQNASKLKAFNQVRKEILFAIKHDNIIPFYQPIVNCYQEIVKYELLMRMKQNKKNKEEYLSPGYFLDVSIKTKLYKKLSEVMIKKSLEFALKKACPLSLNISMSDIQDTDINGLLDFYLNKDNIYLCKLITFEILEDDNIQDIKILTDFINKYRKLGVKFAIDDFGTGYSNFSNILTIDPDYIKIDGSLIKNIDTSKNSYELVKSILRFSKELKIKTIAEYVHNQNVFDITYDLGVDMFQGYYFSEPLENINA